MISLPTYHRFIPGMGKRGILFLFIMFHGWFSGAQSDSVFLNRKYLNHFVEDAGYLISSPVHWKGNDWMKAALFTGITVALTATDQEVKNHVPELHSSFAGHVSRYGLEPFGHIYSIAAAGGFLAYGWYSDNRRSRSTGLLAAESIVLTSLLVRIPKILCGRSRPDSWWNPGPGEWKGPFNGKSFPSGHSAAVFSVASVISYQYRDTRWVPFLAYSIAGMTALSRVYDNRHWLSDVFAGSVLGTATGLMICRRHEGKPFQATPSLSAGANGISLVWEF